MLFHFVFKCSKFGDAHTHTYHLSGIVSADQPQSTSLENSVLQPSSGFLTCCEGLCWFFEQMVVSQSFYTSIIFCSFFGLIAAPSQVYNTLSIFFNLMQGRYVERQFITVWLTYDITYHVFSIQVPTCLYQHIWLNMQYLVPPYSSANR